MLRFLILRDVLLLNLPVVPDVFKERQVVARFASDSGGFYVKYQAIAKGLPTARVKVYDSL